MYNTCGHMHNTCGHMSGHMGAEVYQRSVNLYSGETVGEIPIDGIHGMNQPTHISVSPQLSTALHISVSPPSVSPLSVSNT